MGLSHFRKASFLLKIGGWRRIPASFGSKGGCMTNLARRIARLGVWGRASAAFAAGLCSALALAPVHFWPVLALTLPILVWLLDGAASAPTRGGRLRRAAATGWFAGFGYFAGGLYWIGAAFLVEPDKYAHLMPFAVAALPAVLALFWAVGAMLAQMFWRPGAARVAAFALGLFAVEWVRGHVFTGFPWNLLGHALAGDGALLQGASLFGAYGLTLLTLLVFASPAAAFDPVDGPERRRRARWLAPGLGALLLLAGEGWGLQRLAGASNAVVDGVGLRLVQASVPQTEKWKPENRKWIFERYLRLSTTGGGETATVRAKSPSTNVTHLIWPESSVPFLFMLNDAVGDESSREALSKLVAGGASLILGAERAEGHQQPSGKYQIDRVFNSMFVLNSASTVAGDSPTSLQVRKIYDKIHLLPFGEYLPFEKTLNSWGIRQLTHLPFSFTAGTVRSTLDAPGGPSFSPLICYEVIFSGSIMSSGDRPKWLLNITNDAWFGVSSGPYQHLDQAKIRAVEEGLPLVRVANTGISAVIDGYGRIIAALPLNEIGVLDSPLPISLTPPPNTSWGNWLLSVTIIAVLTFYRIVPKIEGSGPDEHHDHAAIAR
jgi:apolipoprotein N-acyltransferase